MGITSVKIPSSVSTIGQRAFYNNKINGYIYKIVLNKNAIIGSCAFCRNSVYGAGFTFNGQAVKGYIGDFSEFADKRFIIPTETPDGKPVTGISDSAFYKAKTWTSFNYYMTKIVNKTNRAFDWKSITGGPSAANFVTGIVENWYGDIEVVRG